ncbi:MAG TPA: hypothetical protein PLJ12_11680 [Planctomycetota bacterium]|nr:hypothetical protein [Planctomycetota bacterium]
MQTTLLDQAVLPAAAHLKELGVPSPDVCFLLGTGLGNLPRLLKLKRWLTGYEIPSAPQAWQEVGLFAGTYRGKTLWMIEDAPGHLQFAGGAGPGQPAWHRGYPVWLAAASGAKLLIHTCAAVGLDANHPVGSLGVVSDHMNLSGTTPLLGLGTTPLGPLFPDQTRLHHRGLRLRVLERAQALGSTLVEGVAACLPGPSLSTPAELAWLRQTPAHLAAQDTAGPWIACAHSGMALLALTAICDDGSGPVRMPELLDRMDRIAPLLEDLLLNALPDLIQVAAELESEA